MFISCQNLTTVRLSSKLCKDIYRFVVPLKALYLQQLYSEDRKMASQTQCCYSCTVKSKDMCSSLPPLNTHSTKLSFARYNENEQGIIMIFARVFVSYSAALSAGPFLSTPDKRKLFVGYNGGTLHIFFYSHLAILVRMLQPSHIFFTCTIMYKRYSSWWMYINQPFERSENRRRWTTVGEGQKG